MSESYCIPCNSSLDDCLCYQKLKKSYDRILAENKRMREALEKIVALESPVLTKKKVETILGFKAMQDEANLSWKLATIAKSALGEGGE